jgi:hypothetical protein
MTLKKLVSKCKEYTAARLRAPPKKLVMQWGKALGVAPQDILTLSDSLPLRHALGNIELK